MKISRINITFPSLPTLQILADFSCQQEEQCTYNIELRRVRATIGAEKKQ